MLAIAIALSLQTSSADLDALAAQVDTATVPTKAIDDAVLAALAEPVKTYNGWTLPAYSFSSNLNTINWVTPKGWGSGVNSYQLGDGTAFCNGYSTKWNGTAFVWEVSGTAKGKYYCSISLLSAELKAWSYVLKQNGR